MSFNLREPVAAPTAPCEVEWEQVDCLLCGGKNWSPLVEARDGLAGGAGRWFLVAQCQDCGLCFTNPRPASWAIERFYPHDYQPRQIGAAEPKAGWRQRWLGHNLRKVLPLHGSGRLLDFGCGSGTFLLRMRDQGWEVTGVESSRPVVERLRTELGLHVVTGSLPHEMLEPESFDVITMWQSLEHVHQPLEVLRAAYRLLVTGGKLIVAVPNIDSLAFRWFGQAWNGLDLPRHLTHFAPWTLRLMLHRAGFRPGTIRMVRRGGWLRDSARNACLNFPNPPRSFHWLQKKLASNLASWYARLTNQSDCMMVTGTKK